MRLRWPWRRTHRAEGNGHVAREAKHSAEKRRAEQVKKWPDVLAARDELARLTEQALRGHR